MAMVCIDGVSECTGCMQCYEAPKPVKWCCECGRAIYELDTYYDIFEDIYCEDCGDSFRKTA